MQNPENSDNLRVTIRRSIDRTPPQEETKREPDDLRIVIQKPEATRTSHRHHRDDEIMRDDEDDEYHDNDDEDYADLEHDFDNEENEEALLARLEEIGDSGRNKHKTFEGIPKQWH